MQSSVQPKVIVKVEYDVKQDLLGHKKWINNDPTMVVSEAMVSVNIDIHQAVKWGVLGAEKPNVTRSGVEAIACPNALNGWG